MLWAVPSQLTRVVPKPRSMDTWPVAPGEQGVDDHTGALQHWRGAAAFLCEAVADQLEDWRKECVEVDEAFERWSRSDTLDRADAYAGYCSALDREQEASLIYRELLVEARRHHGGMESGLGSRQRTDSAARVMIADERGRAW